MWLRRPGWHTDCKNIRVFVVGTTIGICEADVPGGMPGCSKAYINED